MSLQKQEENNENHNEFLNHSNHFMQKKLINNNKV